MLVAHRVFRSFPTVAQVAARIEEFIARLSERRVAAALSLCPVEDLAHAMLTDDELAPLVAQRCVFSSDDNADVARFVSRLGPLDREVVLTRDNNEVLVCAGFGERIFARFVMTESHSDRWTLWFDRFE